jgi:hypothetical protein
MLIYLESSEAASMFEQIIPKNLSILTMSATRSDEISFATFCYPSEKVKSQHFGFCLGDVFSTNWMKDAENSDLKKETI